MQNSDKGGKGGKSEICLSLAFWLRIGWGLTSLLCYIFQYWYNNRPMNAMFGRYPIIERRAKNRMQNLSIAFPLVLAGIYYHLPDVYSPHKTPATSSTISCIRSLPIGIYLNANKG